MGNPWRYWWVTHEDLAIMNPLSSRTLDRAVDRMALPRGARVVDIACGKGELLFRLAAKYEAEGTGVDISSYNIHAARAAALERAGGQRVRFVLADGADYRPPQGRVHDAAACVGATWVFGGFRGTARALSAMTKDGGVVVIGHPFWRRSPSTAYLRAEGLDRHEYGSREEDAAAAEDEGLSVVARYSSSKAEWHHYEASQWRAAKRFADAHPDDPLSEELRRRRLQSRRAFFTDGHECLGWTLWILRKLGPQKQGKKASPGRMAPGKREGNPARP